MSPGAVVSMLRRAMFDDTSRIETTRLVSHLASTVEAQGSRASRFETRMEGFVLKGSAENRREAGLRRRAALRTPRAALLGQAPRSGGQAAPALEEVLKGGSHGCFTYAVGLHTGLVSAVRRSNFATRRFGPGWAH